MLSLNTTLVIAAGSLAAVIFLAGIIGGHLDSGTDIALLLLGVIGAIVLGVGIPTLSALFDGDHPHWEEAKEMAIMMSCLGIAIVLLVLFWVVLTSSS